MAAARVDVKGRLLQFRTNPPDREAETGPPTPPPGKETWRQWFDKAELDFDRFAPAEPAWVPPSYADARFAWST